MPSIGVGLGVANRALERRVIRRRSMTVVALRRVMRDPEPRGIEGGARPTRRRVTVLTGGAERRRRVIGAGRGVIVLLVARHARRALARVHTITVALLARGRAVPARQREA